MKGKVFAALFGVLVSALLATAYFAPLHFGVAVDPTKVLAVGVILAAGASLSAVMMTAIKQPRPAPASRPGTYSPLNEDPVLHFIGKFQDPDVPTISVFANAGDAASDVLARHSELKAPDKNKDKEVFLTIKGGRKAHNPVELKQLFEKLVEFPYFFHVLLVDGKGEYLGYIPAKAVKKQFIEKNGETQITTYIVDVFADHKKSEELRKIHGAAQQDTIEDTADILDAGRIMRKNEAVEALVVFSKRKPFGVLDKQSVLTLTTTGAV